MRAMIKPEKIYPNFDPYNDPGKLIASWRLHAEGVDEVLFVLIRVTEGERPQGILIRVRFATEVICGLGSYRPASPFHIKSQPPPPPGLGGNPRWRCNETNKLLPHFSCTRRINPLCSYHSMKRVFGCIN